MRNMLLVAFSILSVTAAAAKTPDCANLEGDWKNDLKSTLTITKVDVTTGRIDGVYESPVGAGTAKYPLIGWFNTTVNPPDPKKPSVVTALSFSVRWDTIGSITAWTGYCDAGKITTVWNLTRPETAFIFEHIVVGADNFTPK